MTVIYKDKVIRSDLVSWDGLSSTYTKRDSTGGTIAGLKIGFEVDVLQVYGGGTNYTKSTIQKCVDAIRSNSCTLIFQPGTWTIDENITIASNFTCRIPAGVVFSVSSGKTLTFNGPVIRDSNTWTSGSGTVTENGTLYFTSKLDLTGAVLQGATPLVFDGGTSNSFKTSFVFADPTANRTVTFPNANVDLTDVLTSAGSYNISGVHTHTAALWEKEGTDVASAATCDIWGTSGNTKHITGSTGPITSFGTAPQAGAWMKVIFDSTPTLTHSANLNILNGGSNVTMAANDFAFVYADTTTQHDVLLFRASGVPITAPTAAQGSALVGFPTKSASASAQIRYTTSDITFSDYRKLTFNCVQLIPSSTAADFYIEFNGDTTAGNYRYAIFGETSAPGAVNAGGSAQIIATAGVHNTASTGGINGTVEIFSPTNTTHHKRAIATLTWHDGTDYRTTTCGCTWRSTAAITQIDFKFSGGLTITTGNIDAYGYKTS